MRDPPGLAVLAMALVWPAVAAGQPGPDSVNSDGAGLIAGRSACPEPAAVWTELGTLVPREHVAARLRAQGAAGTPVEILDLGATYRVVAARRVREYRDDARDCAHRSRIAALFIALAVDPAGILSEAAPAPAAPPPVAPVAAPPPPAPREPTVRIPVARLGLGATAEGGLGAHAEIAQAGGWLQLAVGRGRWTLATGAGLLAPVATTVGGVSVDAWRVPVNVGARVALGGRRLERYGELGVSAALAWQRGAALAAPRTGTALEVGAQGSIGIVWSTAGRLAPFAALRAEVVPVPPRLFALPQGELGTLPYLRIGIVAGVELEFFR